MSCLAYAIGHLHNVTMGPEIVEYLRRIDATLEAFGGRFIIHGGNVEVMEGSWSGDLIVIAFPDVDLARAWYTPLPIGKSRRCGATIGGRNRHHGRRAADASRDGYSRRMTCEWRREGALKRLGDLVQAHHMGHLLHLQLLLVGEPGDQRRRRPIEPLDGVAVEADLLALAVASASPCRSRAIRRRSRASILPARRSAPKRASCARCRRRRAGRHRREWPWSRPRSPSSPAGAKSTTRCR